MLARSSCGTAPSSCGRGSDSCSPLRVGISDEDEYSLELELGLLIIAAVVGVWKKCGTTTTVDALQLVIGTVLAQPLQLVCSIVVLVGLAVRGEEAPSFRFFAPVLHEHRFHPVGAYKISATRRAVKHLCHTLLSRFVVWTQCGTCAMSRPRN